MDEDGEGEPELVALEGPLWLSDYDPIEATNGVAEKIEELRRFGSS
jgi:hypothetical protein